MPQPFEIQGAALADDIEVYVDNVYADLESSFLTMPRGVGFIEYSRFQAAYECLKSSTRGFTTFTPGTSMKALVDDSLVLVIIRTILGMTPPEWASLASDESGVDVPQGAARSIDQKARTQRTFVARLTVTRNKLTLDRIDALIQVACKYIITGAPKAAIETVHRLDKVDTAQGLVSIRRAADIHVPYAVLLYERYLGRPFASHRDSISELVGDVMESAVEAVLQNSHVTFRKTKRAEQIPGFDQSPDFIIPDELAPHVVIEAKITNDDGTARDKVTRIIHLTEISRLRISNGQSGFEVVACIDGRGFGVRREDMRRLIVSTNGKVFTLRTLDQLIQHTNIQKFATTTRL